VAQLEEAKKKDEEEKAAAEEARTVQQLLDNAKVGCLVYSRISLIFFRTVMIIVEVKVKDLELIGCFATKVNTMVTFRAAEHHHPLTGTNSAAW